MLDEGRHIYILSGEVPLVNVMLEVSGDEWAGDTYTLYYEKGSKERVTIGNQQLDKLIEILRPRLE